MSRRRTEPVDTPVDPRPLDLFTLLRAKDAFSRAAEGGMSDSFIRGYMEAWVDGQIVRAKVALANPEDREA